MKPLLQVSDLSVSFKTETGKFQALKDISFSVGRGEILAIVGESGSGKSVTSLSILQLLPVPPASYDSGRILFSPDGVTEINMLGLREKELSRIRGNKISMIFQEPMTSLNPVMNCGEQVAEAIRLHQSVSQKEAAEKTLQLFERVQLPTPVSVFSRYPHQLSGGQKQRVMIAMAMSCRPDLLIADEPTTALDVTVQKTILQLIRNLQQEEGMGVIFITHDLGIVAELADRVMVMYKGSVVEEGPVAQIMQQPKHPYTKALLSCRPALHPKQARLPVVSDFIREDMSAVPDLPIVASGSKVSGQINETADTKRLMMQVKDLRVWFPGQKRNPTVKAVDDISFDVFEAETLGLVGESGCGKTTLGRTLLGLITPTRGDILFRDRNIASISRTEWKDLRKEIQIVFQDPYSSLNPRLTVGSAITEPLKVHGLYETDKKRKDKVVELLEKVNLKADHFNRYPHEFSGGQRQRIGIARALALNPGFIVFDESVSALDVSVQAQVLNLLNDLKRELKFTAIFISHDLSVVHYISDRILVMQKGKIVETGTADEVFHEPKEEYTRQLVEAIPGGSGILRI
jgi:peptide/nickel transport system ATP-binding protein